MTEDPVAGTAVAPVEALARAKLNLYLAVGARREDGYHELSSVMQTVELTDTVVVRPTLSPSVEFIAGRGFAGDMPEPPDLVAQALALYCDEGPGAAPLGAEVTKVIPMASGLAGGSADAAAALLAANALNASPLARDRLEAMGRGLGSDVMFCMRGGTALVEGRGNLVSPLVSPHLLWWVLGISDFRLGSGDVYRRFDELAVGLEPLARRPERPVELAKALVTGQPKQVAALLRNDLEAPALDLAPSLAGLKEALRRAGAVGVVLSGSGPTLAGLCRDEAHAEEVAARASAEFPRVEVVSSARAGAEVVGGGPVGLDLAPGASGFGEPVVEVPFRRAAGRPTGARRPPGRGGAGGRKPRR